MTPQQQLILKQREALEKIANPLKYLQKEAEAQGCYLNGAGAISLINNANWLQSIAQKALVEIESLEQQLPEQESNEEPMSVLCLLNKYTTTSLSWVKDYGHNFVIDPMDYHKIDAEYNNQFKDGTAKKIAMTKDEYYNRK